VTGVRGVSDRLMACPDCDRQISKKAHVCPHCGRQIVPTVLDARATGVIVMLIIAFIFGVALFASFSK
jgi:predicted RNA-binding Zn-ribbon protein involved in translation (DUF1610 family)